MKRLISLQMVLAIAVFMGCGPIPKVREDHTGLAPWESFPEDASIRYLEKLVDDPGMEPRYVALIEYDNDSDVGRYVEHFRLAQRDTPKGTTELSGVQRQLGKFQEVPGEFEWLSTEGMNRLYTYKYHDICYEASLWVDTENKKMLFERCWY